MDECRGPCTKAPSGRFRGGEVLRVPDAYIPAAGARVMSLTDGRGYLIPVLTLQQFPTRPFQPLDLIAP